MSFRKHKIQIALDKILFNLVVLCFSEIQDTIFENLILFPIFNVWNYFKRQHPYYGWDQLAEYCHSYEFLGKRGSCELNTSFGLKFVSFIKYNILVSDTASNIYY